MLINEVSKVTNLTKKAIEYYVEQKLIRPTILENGYKDFNSSDVDGLRKVSVLRKLGLCTQDIRVVLADETGDVLQKIVFQKELNVQREQVKKALLQKLCSGASYSEVSADLETLARGSTVTERLLTAFPGYYGRFICLHFARFLNAPIENDEQIQAYNDLMAFLDAMPPLVFPEELQTFLDKNTGEFTVENIGNLLDAVKHSVENPSEYIANHKEVFERYSEYMQSDEYKSSPSHKLHALLKEFNTSSGYYDIFIPAMKRLSKSYAEYSKQMEIACNQLGTFQLKNPCTSSTSISGCSATDSA